MTGIGELCKRGTKYYKFLGVSSRIRGTSWERILGKYGDNIQGIPTGEKLIIFIGDLNDHICIDISNYEGVHEGFGYGVRNGGGEKILDFCTSYDLVIAKTCF